MQKEWNKKNIYTVVKLGLFAAFLLWVTQNTTAVAGFFGKAWRLVFPLVIGLFLAFVLNIPMCFFERHFWPKNKNERLQKLRRPLALLLSAVCVLGVLFGVINLVLPEVVSAFTAIGKAAPGLWKQLQSWVIKSLDEYPQIVEWFREVNIDWANVMEKVTSFISVGTTSLVGNTLSFIGDAVGGITNGIIAIVFCIYILMDKAHLKQQVVCVLAAFLPQRVSKKIFHVARVVADNFSRYVSVQCIEACILGSLCTIGMLVLGLLYPALGSYAIMVGALVCVMALIPIVGAFISMGVGALLIFMIDPISALVFVIFLLILQQIEGNLIYPRVVGKSVGLPAIWVLFAVTVGGGLMGLFGMILGVPLASATYELLREETIARNEKNAAIAAKATAEQMEENA